MLLITKPHGKALALASGRQVKPGRVAAARADPAEAGTTSAATTSAFRWPCGKGGTWRSVFSAPLFCVLLVTTTAVLLWWVAARGTPAAFGACRDRQTDRPRRRPASRGPRAQAAAGRGSSPSARLPRWAPAWQTPLARLPGGIARRGRIRTKPCTSCLLWVRRRLSAGRSLASEMRGGRGVQASSAWHRRPHIRRQEEPPLFAEQRCTSLYRPLAVPHHAPVYQLHLTGPLIPHVSPSHSKKATARIYLVPRYAPSSLLSDKVVSRVSVLFSLIPPLLTCWDKLLAAHLRTALVLFANGKKRLIEREHNGSDFCAAAWKLACDQRKVNNLPPDL